MHRTFVLALRTVRRTPPVGTSLVRGCMRGLFWSRIFCRCTSDRCDKRLSPCWLRLFALRTRACPVGSSSVLRVHPLLRVDTSAGCHTQVRPRDHSSFKGLHQHVSHVGGGVRGSGAIGCVTPVDRTITLNMVCGHFCLCPRPQSTSGSFKLPHVGTFITLCFFCTVLFSQMDM